MLKLLLFIFMNFVKIKQRNNNKIHELFNSNNLNIINIAKYREH